MSAAKPYWDVRFSLNNRIDAASALEELQRRLQESIRLRMIADVPLGAFLSGGVDSSAVVAMMATVSKTPVRTCAIGFKDPKFNESDFAQLVADRYQTEHHLDVVDSDDFDLIDRLAWLYDEPYADSSAIPTYRVCQLARRHVTVALSGDGGDESFGGYRRYRFHLLEEKARSIVPSSAPWAIFIPRPTGRHARCAPKPPSRPWPSTPPRPTCTPSRYNAKISAPNSIPRNSSANLPVTAPSTSSAATPPTPAPMTRSP